MECTKGGCDKPRAGSKPWCKQHLAEYQREYQMAKLGRAASKGFVRGREAMRTMVANEFAALGSGRFSAEEVAVLVWNMPGPQPENETADEEEHEAEKVPS